MGDFASEKVKLLILNEPAPYVLDFLRVLGMGNRKDILVFFKKNTLSQPWKNKRLEKNELNISFLPKNRGRAILLLWRLIKRDKIKLIHTSGWHGFVMLFVWGLSWIKKIPLFVELDTTLCNDQNGIKNRIRHIFYPLLLSIPTCLLPAGKRGREFLQYYGVDKSKIVIHKMTVDVLGMMKSIDQLRNSIIKSNDCICRFLFVGRLIQRKNLAVLIKAFEIVTNQNSNSQLIIVGDGELRQEIIHASRNNSRIIVCGHLEGIDLQKQYALADVFVFPAYKEPWGLVINEAMASSLPIIATGEVGCVDDLIVNELNGFLVSPDEPIEFAKKMLILAGSPLTRRDMGQANRIKILHWTMENQVNIIEKAWIKYAGET